MTDKPAELTPEVKQQLDDDLHIYGTAFAREVNGTMVRIPPDKVIMMTNTPKEPAGKKVQRSLDELEAEIRELPTWALGQLKRFVVTEYDERIRFEPGLTEDEQNLLPDKLACVKAVRDRTGLGLVDSKELVERWLAKRASATARTFDISDEPKGGA